MYEFGKVSCSECKKSWDDPSFMKDEGVLPLYWLQKDDTKHPFCGPQCAFTWYTRVYERKPEENLAEVLTDFITVTRQQTEY